MEKIQLALKKARETRSGANGEAVPLLRPQQVEPRLDGLIKIGDLSTIREARLSPKALARHRSVTTIGNHIAVEAFRMLRAHVVNRLDAMDGQLIAVTSPHQGDGKTFVALNLAITLSRELHRNAILIDSDIRRPAFHRYLAATPDGETSDVLLGKKSLAECLLRTDHDNLLVLPQVNPIRRSSELLGSEPMVALVRALRQHFPDRLVIFDSPPLLATDDSLVLQRIVDSVLLVVQEGSTTKSDLVRAAGLIGEDRFLGCVMNNAHWHELPAYYYF